MKRALLLTLLFFACTPPSTTTGNPPSEAGKFTVFTSGDGIDVDVDSSVAPLSVAATVVVDGATIAGPAVLKDAAKDRDLFTQKQSGTVLRFAISDSRNIRMSSRGTLIHIPLTGSVTHATVKDISAAKDDGNAITLSGFDAAPGSR